MSHIGKQPIALPDGVTVTIAEQAVRVKGPKGELSFMHHPDIAVTTGEGGIVCTIARPGKRAKALWGTTRARLNNMVRGVTEGFTRTLELHGVGYRAAVKGNTLELAVGFSHPVVVTAPAGVTFAVQKEVITISGIDIQAVGQVAATIRAVRPPEPYKGKGIHYQGETVRRKVGKVVGTTA